jgi:anti-sigma factor RsiW
MNYHRPELGERLAADYALGLMPARARRRFERALAGDATLSACVAAWSDRLAPLDAIADEVTPPARVWHAIERRIAVLAPPAVKVRRPSGALVLWRYFGAAAASACAALALYIAIGPGPLPKAITQFADTGGIASWINSGKHSPGDVAISSIQPGTSERERPRWIRGTLLLTPDGAPPITIEPPAPR